MTHLTIRKERSLWRIPSHKTLCALVQRARRYAHVPNSVEVAVVFVGDGAMQRLNATYRAKQKTTDVLSFGYTKTKILLEGDIIICIPQARRQAHTIGNALHEEIHFLFVHGFLHLLGYDHERGRVAERRMFALQRKILGRRT